MNFPAIAAVAARSCSLSLYSTFSASIIFLLFVIMIKKRSSSSRMPPGPPGWPIVGNLFQMGKNPHESFFHLANQYGPLMTLCLGMKTLVVVSSPNTAKEVLKINDQLFAGQAVPEAVKRGPNAKSSLVWAQYGPRWRMLRRICSTELFSVSRLNALQHLRRDHVFQAIRLIYDEHHKNPHESFFRLANEYGPLMALRLGMKTVVVVSSSATAREVLKNNDHLFAGRSLPEVMKSGGNSKPALVWSQCGPRWRMLRKICSTELFSVKRLNDFQDLRRDQVFQTIRQIYEQHRLEGMEVNIELAAFLTTLNLLGNMIFSQNIFGRASEAAEELKESLFKIAEIAGMPNLAEFFPFLQFLDPQGIGRHRAGCLKRVFELWDKFIEDRLSSTPQSSNHGAAAKDLLDVLLESSRTSESGSESDKFSKSDIAPLLLDLFIAGTDTTSATIEWAMAELIRNPQAMQGVQEELDKVVGRDRRVEEPDIQNLPYLQAVVKEVFRLHPAVPFLIPHRAESRCEIAGFGIPKHTKVIVNAWAIGRDPSVWNKPSEFIPERFLEREIDFKGNDLELIPFGAGRRICAGLPLATRLVHFLVASLVHSFDWCLPNGQNPQQIDMTERFGITLQKHVPLMAIPSPRLPSSLY